MSTGRFELVIVRGLPGSGKSSYARSKFPDHFLHYEPDHLFFDTHGRYRYDQQLWNEACDWVYKLTDFALARKESVIVSDVFPTYTEILPYEKLARAHGVRFSIYTMPKKIYNDDGSLRNIHNVPLTILKRMEEVFEYNIGETVYWDEV